MKSKTKVTKAIIGKIPLQKQTGVHQKITWLNEKVLKHQEDQSEKQIHLSGFIVFYKRPYELLHTYEELFERQIYKFATMTKKPLIIDCGSNIGLSVLYFKTLFPDAVILSFEPDETNFTLLKKNIAVNHLSSVTPFQAAIWIHNETLQFSSTGSEASHISEPATDTTIKVKAVRLRNILEQHEKVDFLKIDIEGAEASVITDISGQLNRVANMFLEYHGKTNETQKLNTIIDCIEKAGFDMYIQNAADLLSNPFFNQTTVGLYDVQLNLFCFRKIE